jgi:tRNA 2-selenouridine synthase SelU
MPDLKSSISDIKESRKNFVEFLLKRKLQQIEERKYWERFNMIFASSKDTIDQEIRDDRKSKRLYGEKPR